MQRAKVSKRTCKWTIFHRFRLPSIQTAFGRNLNEYMLSGEKRYTLIDTVTYLIDSPRENLVYLRCLKRCNRLSVRMNNVDNDLYGMCWAHRGSDRLLCSLTLSFAKNKLYLCLCDEGGKQKKDIMKNSRTEKTGQTGEG